MSAIVKTEYIARICHEANRAWCQVLGDTSQLPWDEAPAWQRDSCIAGVEAKLENPQLTPEQSHEGWMKYKADEGWKWGPVKDADKLEHPSFMPYHQLPYEERLKDAIFTNIVKAFY